MSAGSNIASFSTDYHGLRFTQVNLFSYCIICNDLHEPAHMRNI